jgi:hypothetical protein
MKIRKTVSVRGVAEKVKFGGKFACARHMKDIIHAINVRIDLVSDQLIGQVQPLVCRRVQCLPRKPHNRHG